MIIPIFDTTFVSINRYLRNIPLSTGGLDHSSHLLVKLGFSTKKTLLILYLISLFIGVIAVITNLYNFRFWIMFFVIFSVVLFSFGVFLSYYRQDMMYISKKVNERNNKL